jgi:subtilisin-like proprotein convertase family protein
VDLYIDHTRDDDLIIEILSPQGTSILLAIWEGSDGDNFHYTTFDELASVDIWAGSAPFTGSYRPEQSLSWLYGEDPNGTWELTVTDDWPSETGVLRGWGLNIY